MWATGRQKTFYGCVAELRYPIIAILKIEGLGHLLLRSYNTPLLMGYKQMSRWCGSELLLSQSDVFAKKNCSSVKVSYILVHDIWWVGEVTA